MNNCQKSTFEKIHILFKRRSLKEWIDYVRYTGIRGILRKVILSSNAIATEKRMARKKLFTKKELQVQRVHSIKSSITFSIIVPLHNTSEKYLSEMINSVANQTYSVWEICLADFSDLEHVYVGDTCKTFANMDIRVKYEKFDKNTELSEAINTCIDMSTGDYMVLLGQNDVLHPSALFEIMKTIEENSTDFIYSDEAKFLDKTSKAFGFNFKPAFSPDTLISNNYIGHLCAFSRELYGHVGNFRKEYDDSTEYDFILRAVSKANKVMHIPEVLYYQRANEESLSYAEKKAKYGKKVVSDFLHSQSIEAEVSIIESCPSIYKVKYAFSKHPKVSILIPNCEHIDMLKKCIDSIQKKTTYDNYEIVIIENNSKSFELFDYYESLEKTYTNVKVIKYDGIFNYSRINNFAAKNTDGEVMLLLNNDVEVISTDWVQEMLMFAIRDDVGAVGAKLYYPDMTIQHAGIVIGIDGLAGHSFYRVDGQSEGYMRRLKYVQNVSAVTGACLMIRREIWNQVSGLNEDFKVAYNDVDLCLRLQEHGLLIVWTPFAELFHNESLSRGADLSKSNIDRFNTEIQLFRYTWEEEIKNGDRYYNPNLRSDNARHLLRTKIKQYKAR